MTEPHIRRNVPYTTTVIMCWKAEIVSPISGDTLVAYGDTVEEARRRCDLHILRECEERGLTIEGRYDPNWEAA